MPVIFTREGPFFEQLIFQSAVRGMQRVADRMLADYRAVAHIDTGEMKDNSYAVAYGDYDNVYLVFGTHTHDSHDVIEEFGSSQRSGHYQFAQAFDNHVDEIPFFVAAEQAKVGI